MTCPVIEAAQIRNVIWIDDLFPEKPLEERKKDARIFLAGCKECGSSIPLSFIDAQLWDEPIEIFKKTVADLLMKMPESELKKTLLEIEKHVDTQTEDDEDLNSQEIASVLNALCSLTKFSYQKWQNESKSVLSSSDIETLFLVDREFTREGLGEDAGDDILSQIVAEAPNSPCVMFTHKVNEEQSNDLWEQIAIKRANLKGHQFSVMSKRNLHGEPTNVQERFEHTLKVSLLRRFCEKQLRQLKQAMTQGLELALNDLSQLPIYALEKSVFSNSLEEGENEIGVMTRLLGIRQEIEIQNQISGDLLGWNHSLARIRAINEATPATSSNDVGFLREWRHRELFVPDNILNQTHQPIRCGDVFMKTNNVDGNKFVLLAHPCDIAVRKNGARVKKNGVLALLHESPPSTSRNQARYFVLKGIDLSGKDWFVDFVRSYTINLEVLDLAVFNKDGMVKWPTDEDCSKQLLPGWRKKYEKLLSSGTPTNNEPPKQFKLMQFPNDRGLPKLNNGNGQPWKYELKRSGNIRSPIAEAILSAFAAYASRAAIDHDFARER